MADRSMDNHVFSAAEIRHQQRTPEGLHYDRTLDALRAKMRTDKAFRDERNAEIAQLRNVGPGQVHSNQFMSTLSIQYKNDDFIGEQLMPVAPVVKLSDAFATYNKRDRFQAPDDSMQSRATANELNETRGSDNYSLQPYALQNSVPAATVQNEDPAFDEMVDLVAAINDTLALKREKRIATVLTTAGNYASGNTATLSGASQWDSAGGGSPLQNIQDAIAGTFTGAGPGDLMGFCSLQVWNVLARHPQLLDLFKYTGPGLTKMDALARELGLAKILVGAAREDTANIGQAASYSRIWGKVFGVVRVARRPSLRNAAFGYTLRRNSDPTTIQWFDPTKGMDGAYFAKVGSYEQHKVVANDTGYLLSAVIS